MSPWTDVERLREPYLNESGVFFAGTPRRNAYLYQKYNEMKLPIVLAGALVLAATTLNAQEPSVQQADEGKYTITCGEVTMTVDPGRGGKILSFRLNEREVISQLRWPNAFGSTFWTSPQAEWNWPPVPEYDSLPYTAAIEDGALVLEGPVSKYGYRIRKHFAADPADGAIAVTYSIVNESGENRKVAPWEITRVPNGGFLEFDAKPEGVTPADLMKVTFDDGMATLEVDVANENRKINVDGKGWLTFRDNGLIMTKRFSDIAPEEAAPGEAEIQVYINGRKTFVEIEAQGPYTDLEPGGQLDWTVRWYLSAEK